MQEIMEDPQDPIEALPEHIWVDVFEYLATPDMLNASLVSQKWYRFIGSSRKCMKKLRIDFPNMKEGHENEIEPLLQSERLYHKAFFFNVCSKVFDTYRNVEIKTRMVIERFHDTLEEIETTNDLQLISDLPKLKKLNFRGPLFGFTIALKSNGLMSKAKNIKELIFEALYANLESAIIFSQCLKTMKDLKRLETCNMTMFHGWISQNYPFQLEELIVHRGIKIVNSEIKMIQIFLTYSSTLKVVRYDDAKYTALSIFLNRFPRLHTIVVESFDKQVWALYPQNYNIKRLAVVKFQGEDENDIKHFTNILRRLPNLQTLELCEINSDVLAIIESHKSLKKVVFQFLHDNVRSKQKSMESHARIKFIKIKIRSWLDDSESENSGSENDEAAAESAGSENELENAAESAGSQNEQENAAGSQNEQENAAASQDDKNE